MPPARSPCLYCLWQGREASSLLSVLMLAPSLRAPSFPPLSDALEALASLPWERIASAALEALLFSVALCHALAARLWRERGRLSPFLRALASWLERLASALPEPLSSASPRALLIEALIEAGESSSSVAKASRSALLRRASRLGLL
jgi:hypothetical protein